MPVTNDQDRLSDEQLARLAREGAEGSEGSEEAFELLVRRMQVPLMKFLLRRLGGQAGREEYPQPAEQDRQPPGKIEEEI